MIKPKHPEWIKIGPNYFEVSIEKSSAALTSAGVMKYYPKMKIVIDGDYDPQHHATTLFHEIQHGIFDICGERDLNQNEGLVERLSHAWLGVMLESPGLLEYLIQRRKANQ